MDLTVKKMLIPAVVALVSTAFLLVVRAVAFKFFYRWAKNTETKLDDIVIKSLRTPSVYWCIAIGLYVGVTILELPQKYVGHISSVIYVIIIFSITIAAANLAGRIFRYYVQKSEIPIPTTGLAHGIIKGSIIVMGMLIILGVLGISVTPLITALGVGGLAVALALQDTLSNLFAGIHILVEKSIRVGDFIRLDSGLEGYVADITWRTTRIRMLPNNMVIIPNSKLSQSTVTNFHLPEKRMAVIIPIGVSYASDPDHVEKVLIDEAKKAAQEMDVFAPDFEPFVRFIPGFGSSSLDFSLICQVKEFVDQYPAQHELRKRIFRRFKEEGIEIPFPQTVVHLKDSKNT